jgi:orotidine-5'-phosphate decarboxylase
MPGNIITAPRSLVPAADMAPSAYPEFVERMAQVPGVYAVKIGLRIAMGPGGLAAATAVAHEQGLLAVYDHQQGGNDIPRTGDIFAEAMAENKVDAAILFPFTESDAVQKAWTMALQKREIGIIVGAEMTHQMPTNPKRRKWRHVIELAMRLGVRDFVVPANKPHSVDSYDELIGKSLGVGNYALWPQVLVGRAAALQKYAMLLRQIFM